MKQEDRDFLDTFVELDRVTEGGKYVCIYKHSSLLLLLPEAKEAALRTLSLYQPQSFKAKLYVSFLKVLLSCGITFLLEKITIGEFREGYTYLSKYEDVGFLLGNPTAQHRRLIVYHGNSERSYVSKLASSEESEPLAAREIDNLNLVSGVLRGAPSISEKNNGRYTVNWIAGKSPSAKDHGALCELLLGWLNTKETCQLGECKVWGKVIEHTLGKEDEWVVEELGKRSVIPCAVHGDFAPWNIKIEKQGEVHVLDWESYEAGGVAGWDWAHYLLQSKLLIGNMWPDEALDLTVRWAKTLEGETFLEKCGWEEDCLGWLGSYLYYAHYVLGFNRLELIECWKKLPGNQYCS